jgi:hypothetical protein
MIAHLNRSIQIHDCSLEPWYTKTWLITWTVVYSKRSYMCILRFKWAVMYLYTTVQVRGDVFVYYGSSDQSCFCILRFKWSVMFLYTTVQVSSHVFVYYGSSERSCICILRFKWEVMYVYAMVQVSAHLNVVCKYMTSHLKRSIQIHDWSLQP